MRLIEKKANNFGEILKAAKSIANRWYKSPTDPQEIFFRGQPAANLPLLPGLYRPENTRFNYIEESLMEHFRNLGTPYIKGDINDQWNIYFLAQHYSLPTRLLDWTYSLTTAVYFAIEGHISKLDRSEYDKRLIGSIKMSIFDSKSPVIWMLDAGSLNNFSCGPNEDYVFTVGGELTKQYLPGNIDKMKNDNLYPLAIYPASIDYRIIAQKSAFTVHGNDRDAIEDLKIKKNGTKILLAKIIIDRNNLERLWEELILLGVNRVGLFPSLDSVAFCVKWDGQNLKSEKTNGQDKIEE